MITIYENRSGLALVSGRSLEEARAKLSALHCGKDVMFGRGPGDLTALDTGQHETLKPTRDNYDMLHIARKLFPEVPARGPGRLAQTLSASQIDVDHYFHPIGAGRRYFPRTISSRQTYRPGSPAPETATYVMLDVTGSPTGTRVRIQQGDVLPTAPVGHDWKIDIGECDDR